MLYGGRTIPMALLTAVAFALLGLGLLLTSGAVPWGVELLTRDSLPSAAQPTPGFPWLPLVLLLFLAGVVGAAGFVYLRWQLGDSRRQPQSRRGQFRAEDRHPTPARAGDRAAVLAP
jgi:hypothetical protein